MKRLLKAAAIGLVLAGAGWAAHADPNPTAYCECMDRCAVRYADGTQEQALCQYSCDVNYGPAICAKTNAKPNPMAILKLPAQKRPSVAARPKV